MTADAHFSPNFPQKLTHPMFFPFELCSIARPSQQQLSSCTSYKTATLLAELRDIRM